MNTKRTFAISTGIMLLIVALIAVLRITPNEETFLDIVTALALLILAFPIRLYTSQIIGETGQWTALPFVICLVLSGCFWGFVIDYIIRKKTKRELSNKAIQATP